MTEAFSKIVEAVRFIFTWWFFVEPWERAIRVRAGKHVRLCGPGVHIKLPFLDTVYVHNTRKRVLVMQPQTLSDRAGSVFAIGVSVGYAIADVYLLHTNVHDPETVIEQQVAQLVSEYVTTAPAPTPEGLHTAVSGVDLASMGLCDVEVCVNNFARVSAMRLVQDNMRPYQPTSLSTTEKHK